MTSERIIKKIKAELGARVKGDVFTDILSRAAFSTDASIYQIMPICVVAPVGAQDVREVVTYAKENGVAITARGAGSGVAG